MGSASFDEQPLSLGERILVTAKIGDLCKRQPVFAKVLAASKRFPEDSLYYWQALAVALAELLDEKDQACANLYAALAKALEDPVVTPAAGTLYKMHESYEDWLKDSRLYDNPITKWVPENSFPEKGYHE